MPLGFSPSMGEFAMPDAIQRLKSYFKGVPEEQNISLQSSPDLNYAVERFRMAYQATRLLGSDEIVLLRQVVRWSNMPDIRIDRPTHQSEQLDQWFSNAGLLWSTSGYLSAKPYAPDWLQAKTVGIDNLPQKCFLDESFVGEPYLQQNINFEKWLSPAQKEASWRVLNTPEGSTCLVVLPTGCGKSSCFWFLPTFSPGLTVVVVPTVALAIDQQQSAVERFKKYPGVNPCYFASDDNPEVTIAKLKNKESRLVFASPETCVSGHLRPVLNTFAQEGWFQNLVVDEAHLIETWGAQFRVEFQVLAAIRKKWLANSGNRLRTFLFSATMSPQCRKTLGEMFSDNNNIQEFACQRLRPEMSYYSHYFQSGEKRWPYLRETLWHLPRPAILYLTKPSDAKTMRDKIRDEEGFKRIGLFTGETKPSAKKTLLTDWKENRIDLMVATSAFGVGVDKADVRTVIHACYPENLDRYYQEVGRSGRDGFSSICIFIPTHADKKIAKGLGTKMLKDENIIQQRWESMYNNRKSINNEDFKFKVPVSVKRLELMGDRTFNQNIKWNKSLLLQLYRAQLIEFLDLELELAENPEDAPEEWATIRVNFSPGTPKLSKKLETIREKELVSFNLGFSQLEELFSASKCISRVFQKLYHIPNKQRVCGGCFFCREQERDAGPCPPLLIPERTKSVSCKSGTIVEGWPDPTQSSQQDDFLDKIEECLSKHLLKPLQLYCPANDFEGIMGLLTGLFRQYRHLYRIDPFSVDTVLGEGIYPSLFLHIGKFSESMLEKAKSSNPIHCFCGILNPYEPNGRHIKIKYDCDLWPSPDAWLGQLN
jgi:ATP-dependent DNA helicase RecQ